MTSADYLRRIITVLNYFGVETDETVLTVHRAFQIDPKGQELPHILESLIDRLVPLPESLEDLERARRLKALLMAV